MSLFLRSIGFSQASEKDFVDTLIKTVIDNPDEKCVFAKKKKEVFVQFNKSFGDEFGFSVIGMLDENEKLSVIRSFPYAFTGDYPKFLNVEFDYDTDECFVICEDDISGFDLIFKLRNIVDYLGMTRKITLKESMFADVAGLSLKGTIILPIEKDEETRLQQQEDDASMKELLKRARKGDIEAQDELDLKELETSEVMQERMMDEDFLSVVEGFFIPNESDDSIYSILGDIVEVKSCFNDMTDEKIFRLKICVTGSVFDIYINAADLTGMPIEGMRFMGNCFIQGKVDF